MFPRAFVVIVFVLVTSCCVTGSAISRDTNSIGNGPVTALNGTSYKILAAANSDLFVLDFRPFDDPPSLSEIVRQNNVITGGAAPWIARHPVNPTLFIIANDNHNQGNLTSWSYDPVTYHFTLLDSVLSKGSCAHIALSPDGSYVHIANLYGNNGQGSNAAVVPVDVVSGKFGHVDVPVFMNFSDYKLKPGQLESSQLLRHCHHWAFHPFLPVAYLSDLGGDIVHRYSIDAPGQLTELEPIESPIASGPRRTIIHPSGGALYTLHEIDSTISVGSINVNTQYGNVTVLQDRVSIIPQWANHSSNAFQGSEIQLTADGRFLYAASRNNSIPTNGTGNNDVISVFSVSTNGTHLDFIKSIPSDLWYLRSFSLSNPYYDQTLRAEKYLVAGGQDSNDTCVFERDLVTGNLTRIARLQGPDSPVSYRWL